MKPADTTPLILETIIQVLNNMDTAPQPQNQTVSQTTLLRPHSLTQSSRPQHPPKKMIAIWTSRLEKGGKSRNATEKENRQNKSYTLTGKRSSSEYLAGKHASLRQNLGTNPGLGGTYSAVRPEHLPQFNKDIKMSIIPSCSEMEAYNIAKALYLNILDFKSPEQAINKSPCL